MLSPSPETAMAPTRSLLAIALALAAPLAAQVPTDAALILQDAPGTNPNYALADVFGRGSTAVAGQNVILTPPPNSVATDPLVGTDFYFLSASAFAGAWRVRLDPLATFQQAVWGAWQQQVGDRLEVGTTRVVTLRNGAVEASLKLSLAPMQPVLLFQLAGAVDLAVAEPFVYVASNAGGGPSPLVEFDLQNGTQRTIGTYANVRSLALSPVSPELCLGLASGDLERVDLATGAVLATQATGLGPIVAVAYTRFGSLVYADAQTVWSELAPSGPIYTSSTTIFDVGVTVVPVASSMPYGSACGAMSTSGWAVTGAPTVGNAGYAVGLRQGVPSSFAVLALGDSRSASTVFGAPLPIDLSALGAPGCHLLVDPLVLSAQPTDATGAANQPFPIPAAPILAGVEWSAQWVQPDAAIGPFGLVTSRGLAIAIR